MAARAQTRVSTVAIWSLYFIVSVLLPSSSLSQSFQGTIAFSSNGRSHYSFDVFARPTPSEVATSPQPFRRALVASGPSQSAAEIILTDRESVNYNGFFPSDSDTQLAFLAITGDTVDNGHILAYVSERLGRAQLFFDLFLPKSTHAASIYPSRAFHLSDYDVATVELPSTSALPFFRDRPSFAKGRVIHTSTEESSLSPRQSWTAVYSTNLSTSLSTRLTPPGIADFSPSVSPSGDWVLVASYGELGWQGEVRGLSTDLYIFNSTDGSLRTLLLKNGGWPSWADDSTFFFHRQAEDGWWSVYRANISIADDVANVTEERVTPTGVHCFTPAASSTLEWIAVATRRTESAFRQIEIFDLQSSRFLQLTNSSFPETNHYNPFVSSDSTLVGYHKCRGASSEESLRRVTDDSSGPKIPMVEEGAENSSSYSIPRLEFIRSPLPMLALLRVDGDFPSFSPDGSLIAYVPMLGESGVSVMRFDGSGVREIYSEASFGTAWDKKREGVVYTSSGPIFASENSTVHIVSIFNAHKLAKGEDVPLVSKTLTKEGSKNNAFPSPSPDGQYVVFRSGRSGYKNLYIMDAVLGEEGGLWRLTEGEWTDTMPSWSPDGQLIVFSSDRENPGEGSFDLYFIHPNGTGLYKVFNTTGGRMNHASFSPDCKTLLFTTDFAGLSAEPISVPHQYQPYGEIFLASIDGLQFQRLTHNSVEDGTPSWGITFISASDLSTEGSPVDCEFVDDTWLSSASSSSVHYSASACKIG